ncbi:hypothetical protein OROGR_006699 [Orobanche gracilis]
MQKMENFMEKQKCSPKLATQQSPLSMHKNSHKISKSNPKIRIIHIFAPEIIKTDAENFRELVQRLTGKPTDEDSEDRDKKMSRRKEHKIFRSNKKKVFDGEVRERVKGDGEVWSGANSGGGFLGGFTNHYDYGFMQEINDEFLFLEGTTTMGVYGGDDQSVPFAYLPSITDQSYY